MEGQSKLTLREAQRKIAYKYYVIRSHAKNLWEGLVGFKPNNPGKHVNRCLIIPPKDIKDAGKFSTSIKSLFKKKKKPNRLSPEGWPK